MHDSLGYVQHEPVHRSYHHGEMTFSLVYAWSENFVLPISHDEVVHGKGSLLRKMPGDRWQQLANLRAYLGLHVGAPRQAAALHGRRDRPGVGVGRGPRARLVAARPPRAPRRPRRWCATSTRRTPTRPALWSRDNDPARFQWIDANDAGRNVFSFVRRGARRRRTWSACRTSPPCRTTLRASGCPRPATWDEVLNTDAETYTGSGVGNLGSVTAVEGEWSGQPAHADLVVPPLATVWLRRGLRRCWVAAGAQVHHGMSVNRRFPR